MGKGCSIGLCVAPQGSLAFDRTKGVDGRAKVNRRLIRGRLRTGRKSGTRQQKGSKGQSKPHVTFTPWTRQKANTGPKARRARRSDHQSAGQPVLPFHQGRQIECRHPAVGHHLPAFDEQIPNAHRAAQDQGCDRVPGPGRFDAR